MYDLMEFAFLRRYILPNDVFVTNANSLFTLELHYKEQLKTLKKDLKKDMARKRVGMIKFLTNGIKTG